MKRLIKMSFSASFVLVIVLILVPNLVVVVVEARDKFEHGRLNREILPAAADSKYSLISSTCKGCAVVLEVERRWIKFNVFCFDHNFDLVLYRDDAQRIHLPFYGKVLYGLMWEYQNANANVRHHLPRYSLSPMDRFAEGSVPKELRPKTPIRVGATPELRWLEGNASELILQSVRDYFREGSSLKFDADDITILNGYRKGFYQWMTVNYLLGNSGKKCSETVGVVDMDGNSVQMAYAMSKEDADMAPIVSVPGQDSYIKEVLLNGTKYYLYAHSYLHYGLWAARAEILRSSSDYNSGNQCILNGFNGVYKYRSGEAYNASASSSGSSFEGCRVQALAIFKFKFNNGVWNGQNKLYASSHFFSMARQVGFVNGTESFAKVGPAELEREGRRACKLKSFEDAKSAYPATPWTELPYLCMDLVYQYTLLVDGFGLNPRQEITLMNDYIDYRDTSVHSLWPLGSGIEAVSNIMNPLSYRAI